jgi:hypothetical protein
MKHRTEEECSQLIIPSFYKTMCLPTTTPAAWEEQCVQRTFNTGLPHFATLINNSFSGNKSDYLGGSIYSKFGKPIIINSIFWNDTSSLPDSYEVFLYYGDTAEISFSDIAAGKINGTWTDGGGNIESDPLFKDPDSLTISSNSPCYNTGTLAYTCQCGETHNCPSCDITGESRPWYGSPDMGAYEFHAPAGIGSRNAKGSGLLCSNHPNPFTTATTFVYNLKKTCRVTVNVFNSFGQLVGQPVNGPQQKGEQKVAWNAESLPAGMYFYRIEAGGMVGKGKIIKL